MWFIIMKWRITAITLDTRVFCQHLWLVWPGLVYSRSLSFISIMSAGNHITGVINMSLTLILPVGAGWWRGRSCRLAGTGQRQTPRYTSYSKLITLGWRAQLTFYFDGENKPKTVQTEYNALTAARHFTPIIGLVLAQGTHCYDWEQTAR